MIIKEVRCENKYASKCKYYQIATEKRTNESKARLISIIVSLISILILGMSEIDGIGWFVGITMFIVPSISTSLFGPKDITAKKVVYYFINIYSVLIVIFCFLGITGVILIENDIIYLAKTGVYQGNYIISTEWFFRFIVFVIPMDFFYWLISFICDNSKEKVVRNLSEGG